jgi:poly-gamma-glutamate synthesis protein (capsule biosynthesis protein)
MTGRGIDQILPYPSDPQIFEPYVKDAREYIKLSELLYGPISHPIDFGYIWGDAAKIWEQTQPDFKIANLETAITGSNEAWPDKEINYRMNPRNVECLSRAGFGCCTLANNHIIDWGYSGLLETLTTLHRNGIETAGAGVNLGEATAPSIKDFGEKGRTIVLSMGMETSGIPSEWAATDKKPGVFLTSGLANELASFLLPIYLNKKPHDIFVVSIHWGLNWVNDIPKQYARLAHLLIDKFNVDIVHGHSSHHALGIEVYKGRLILYGCGDFISDYEGISGYENFRGDISLMYFADIDNRGVLQDLTIFPMKMRKFQLNHLSADDRGWLEKSLNSKGEEFGTSVIQDQNCFRLQWKKKSM